MKNKDLSVLKLKGKTAFLLSLAFMFTGCSSVVLSDTTIQNTTSIVAKTIQSPETVITDNLPDSSDDASLQDKYDLQDFIQSNGVLERIPTTVADYKVNFTSDGGAVFFTGDGGPVFATKAVENSSEISWNRKSEELLFDTLQVLNVKDKGAKVYGRYSQLLKTSININNAGQQFVKSVDLVQTVGLGLLKSASLSKVSGLTPVVIRLPDKKSLPYKIEMLTLKSGNTIININEKSIVKWPGFIVDPESKDNKVSVEVSISSTKEFINDSAVILSLHEKQIQLNRVSESKYSGEISITELETKNTSLTVELIDKNSFEKDKNYNGYTWIIPYYSDI